MRFFKPYLFIIAALLMCVVGYAEARPSGSFRASSASAARSFSRPAMVRSATTQTNTVSRTTTTQTTRPYVAPTPTPRPTAPFIPPRPAPVVTPPVSTASTGNTTTVNRTVINHYSTTNVNGMHPGYGGGYGGGGGVGNGTSFLGGMAAGALVDHLMNEHENARPYAEPMAVAPVQAPVSAAAPVVAAPAAPPQAAAAPITANLAPGYEVSGTPGAYPADTTPGDPHAGRKILITFCVISVIGGLIAVGCIFVSKRRARKEAEEQHVNAITLNPEFPDILPGMTVDVHVPYQNPPIIPEGKFGIHFEPDVDPGINEVLCVGADALNFYLYLTKDQKNFFVLTLTDDRKDIEDNAMFFSWICDLDALDPDTVERIFGSRGALGEQFFSSDDGCVWTRSIMPASPEWVNPIYSTERLVYPDEDQKRRQLTYMIFERQTNLGAGTPETEYLLVRRTSDLLGSRYEAFAGVAVRTKDVI